MFGPQSFGPGSLGNSFVDLSLLETRPWVLGLLESSLLDLSLWDLRFLDLSLLDPRPWVLKLLDPSLFDLSFWISAFETSDFWTSAFGTSTFRT